jgi:hypothetical protein
MEMRDKHDLMQGVEDEIHSFRKHFEHRACDERMREKLVGDGFPGRNFEFSYGRRVASGM